MDVKTILADYSPDEVRERLDNVFSGYLSADTGDTPDEQQTNFELFRLLKRLFD